MDSAKRVVLRIQESDVKPDDLFEPVRLYLQKTRHSLDETEDPWNRHFIHLQPPSNLPQKNPKIHIIIDLNKDQYLKAFVDRDFPHECYRIKYINNKMEIFYIRHPENMIRAIRGFTDEIYPWGKDHLHSGGDAGQP